MYNLLFLSTTLCIIITSSHCQHLDSILSDKSYLDKVDKIVAASVKEIRGRFASESKRMEQATKQFVLVKLRQNLFEALLTITDRKLVEQDRKDTRQDSGIGAELSNLIELGVGDEDTANGLNTGLKIGQGILKFFDKAAKQVFGGVLAVISGISGGGAGGAGGAAASASAASGGGTKNKGNAANAGNKLRIYKGYHEVQRHQSVRLDPLFDTLTSARNKPFHEQFFEIMLVTPGVNFLSGFKRSDILQPVIASSSSQANFLLDSIVFSTPLADEGNRDFIGYLTKNYLKIWETLHSKAIPNLYDGLDEPLHVLESLNAVNGAIANKTLEFQP